MARYFAPISAAELSEIIKKKAKKLNPEAEELREQVMALFDEMSKMATDLKVEVDFENFECESGEGFGGAKNLVGFHSMPNGLTCLGCTAGGDWEIPLFFIIYWDGKNLRIYVPTEGNTWNTDTNSAYGNNGKSDYLNAKRRWPELTEDFDKCILENDESYFDTSIIPEISEDLVIKDIEARLQPRTADQKDDDGPSTQEESRYQFEVIRTGIGVQIRPTVDGHPSDQILIPRSKVGDLVKKIIESL